MSETTILTEQYDTDVLIEEREVDGQKEKLYFLEGICIQTNLKNRNGRIYPKPLVDRELGRYINEKLSRSQAVGELNHPESDNPARLAVIDPERVSHRYLWIKEDGDNYVARAQVAHKTPMGSVVAGLMECGVVMGTSSRARGSIKLHEGAKIVQNDFRLITPGDIVWEPSAPDAYLTNLMEGKEWTMANGVLVEMEREIKSNVNKLARARKLDKKHTGQLFDLIMAKVKGE